MPGVVVAPGGGGTTATAPLQQQQQQPQPGGVAGMHGLSPLDFLRGNEQFQQMRQMIQAQPQLLPAVLQSLSQTNPPLFQLITAHQEEFAALINEGGPISGAAAPHSHSGGQIQVTPEERAAIERLEGLGFDRATVLQAYFACDKSEELAANWLLEHGHDFDGGDDDCDDGGAPAH